MSLKINNDNIILIMAAGTGGHIYPALEVANYFVKQGFQIQWLGTNYGLEQKLVKNKYKLHEINIHGIRNKGIVQKLKSAFELLNSVINVRKIIKQYKPKVVIGFGGYICGAGGLATLLSRNLNLIIHEQNATLGTANRLLALFAHKILLGFPKVHRNGIFVGNPTRAAFAKITKKFEAEKPLKVLVIGGSQGAKFINQLMPQVVTILGNDSSIKIKHQTGINNYAETLAKYSKQQINVVTVIDYIEDMAAEYLWADCIICRSGAMTVSETINANLPAIFIPLPSAIDDHQTKNANFAVAEQAALLMPQSNAKASAIAKTLLRWAKNKQLLQDMSSNCKRLAKTNSAKLIYLEAIAK